MTSGPQVRAIFCCGFPCGALDTPFNRVITPLDEMSWGDIAPTPRTSRAPRVHHLTPVSFALHFRRAEKTNTDGRECMCLGLGTAVVCVYLWTAPSPRVVGLAGPPEHICLRRIRMDPLEALELRAGYPLCGSRSKFFVQT